MIISVMEKTACIVELVKEHKKSANLLESEPKFMNKHKTYHEIILVI
jgi:hypothetical protein